MQPAVVCTGPVAICTIEIIDVNPLSHAATGTVYRTGGCMHKTVNVKDILMQHCVASNALDKERPC